MKHLIDIMQLTPQEIMELIDTACAIMEHPEQYAHKCDGKILATLFFEPSTRTRLSFESAMLSLGGKVLSVASAESSSASKGETVADTVRVVSCYSDIIAMRHPKEGAPLVASMHAQVPVINAGDGGHNHPTQTLTDLMTIYREKGRLDDLTIGLCGDLKFGRTVHSLVAAMSRCTGIRFVLISPEELKLPRYVKDEYLKKPGVPYTQSTSLEAVMPELDVLYMTRVQRERFFNEEDYLRLRDSYILTPDKLETAKPDMSILHPLPRVNEIAAAVDNDPRACYFRQAKTAAISAWRSCSSCWASTDGRRNVMLIDSIQNGIVIDHITAGKAMELYQILGLDKLACTVAILKNVTSGKLGRKDIIKIDGEMELDWDLIGYVDPSITVNIIRGGELQEKRTLKLPERIRGVLRCKNPRCITSTERELPQEFVLTDRERRVYRCLYCETEAGK